MGVVLQRKELQEPRSADERHRQPRKHHIKCVPEMCSFSEVSPYKEEGRGGKNKGFQCKAMNQQLYFLDDCTVNKHLH